MVFRPSPVRYPIDEIAWRWEVEKGLGAALGDGSAIGW